MQPLAIVNDLRIASPCPASWDTMQGDDRTRFCETCSKNVYNVSDLTSTEITDLIQKAEGRLCIRLYRRKDGTVLTADCPVGFRYSVRRRLVRLLTIGVILAATIRAGAWCSMRRSELTELPPPPTGPGVTFSDWADWATVALGMRRPATPPVTPPRFLVGKLATRQRGEMTSAEDY